MAPLLHCSLMFVILNFCSRVLPPHQDPAVKPTECLSLQCFQNIELGLALGHNQDIIAFSTFSALPMLS